MRGFKHFFSAPPVRTAELTVRGIGVQEHMPPSIIDRTRGTGDYLLMFFYDSVWIGAGKKPVRQPTGTLMFWTPGRSQYYGDRERPYNHTWIHCDGRLIRALLRKNRLPCNRPFHLPDPSPMEQHLLEIHTELTRHARPDHTIVHNLLENWLRATARSLRTQNAPPVVPDGLLAVRHLIESEHARELTLAFLASQAHLSVSHFCAEFKKHFDVAPIEYLIRQRMHHAAFLLRDRKLTISQIGHRVGYDDLFQFSKLFKKHFGASPRHWRKDLS